MKQQIPPSQLFIGPHEELIKHTKTFLKQVFCENNLCLTCITCRQIEDEQFHGATWLQPEKQYKLEQLNPIFKTIVFSLEQNKKFFFIIQKADFLTTACSNSLLKSVEEPPPGYHFIFLTEREQQILPTIRSRSTTTSLYIQKEKSKDQFIQIFKQIVTCTPSPFLKILSDKNPNERETIELLDALLSYWIYENKKQFVENNYKKNSISSKAIDIIKTALKNPPMPGSSKIFWKNFYLQMKKL